ncbi:MAG: flagellar hook-basal body complex protein, partial [Candidatus Latescibacteria bacterium]|nr:flagellar hook-basal body complex protein [Candidatus Latescibacterota bacterium]
MGFDAIFAAVSGIQSHQTRINVIGNNIANLNTVGFKAGRAVFQDALVQTFREATGRRGGLAGTNPSQVGLGATVGAIDNVFTQGTIQTTGKTTDLAVEGKGFFILSNGATRVFTRSGSFSFDDVGRLINPANGFVVQGRVADETGTLSAELKDIRIPFNRESEALPTTSIRLSGNLDATAGGAGAPEWSETTIFGTPALARGTGTPSLNLTANQRLTITVTDNIGRETSGTIGVPAGQYTTIDDLITATNAQIDTNGSLKGLVRASKATVGGANVLVLRTVKGGTNVTMTIDEVTSGALARLGLAAAGTSSVTATDGTFATSTMTLNSLANVAANLDNNDILRFSGVKPDGAKFDGVLTYNDADGDGVDDAGDSM